MAYNPYAAPIDPRMQGPTGPVGPAGTPQPWEPGEVIRRAWETVKVHGVPLVVGSLVRGAGQSLPQQFMRFRDNSKGFDITDPFFLGVLGGGSIIGVVLQAFFQAGVAKMYVSAARTSG